MDIRIRVYSISQGGGKVIDRINKINNMGIGLSVPPILLILRILSILPSGFASKVDFVPICCTRYVALHHYVVPASDF